MKRRALVAVSALVVAACAVAPRDPFDRGTLAVRRGELLEAMRAFESVPATHPRHAEAVTRANELEDRLRRSHEALLAGIVLRGEGRDREALASLQQARDAWPRLPTIDSWIAATRDRWSTTSAKCAATPLHVPAVDCEAECPPVPEVVAATPSPAPAVESSPDRTRVVRAPDAEAVGGDDAVTLGLVAVEARLGHGELELAVIDLLELARRFPNDLRVQNRLVRVLHQRALLRYGQGALTTAIADWERVLAIQPDNRTVKALLDAVRAEAAAPL